MPVYASTLLFHTFSLTFILFHTFSLTFILFLVLSAFSLCSSLFFFLSASLCLSQVWSTRYVGMWGDDVAKMPHMARIAGSVYPDISADDYYMSRDKVRGRHAPPLFLTAVEA